MQACKEELTLAKPSLYENFESYEYLGSHPFKDHQKEGFIFRVWAPNATSVSVVGDFNNWNPQSHPMNKATNEGVWELFIENVEEFWLYKYAIMTRDGRVLMKSDPYAFHSETRENTASYTYSFKDKFTWTDEDWQE